MNNYWIYRFNGRYGELVYTCSANNKREALKIYKDDLNGRKFEGTLKAFNDKEYALL